MKFMQNYISSIYAIHVQRNNDNITNESVEVQIIKYNLLFCK